MTIILRMFSAMKILMSHLDFLRIKFKLCELCLESRRQSSDNYYA